MNRWSTCFFSIVMFVFCLLLVLNSCPFVVSTWACCYNTDDEKSSQEIIAIDEIALKQKEMRDVTVLVQTLYGSGSGIIIDCFETETDGIFEYIVLTNAHVINGRFVTILREADSFTGKVKTERIDTGCHIIVFNYTTKDRSRYNTTVIVEDNKYDFAMLSFHTAKKLPIAKLANNEILDQVRVFDEIFAIGCQLGNSPSPTTGIISQIITDSNGEKELIVYCNTAQISPGSSGGGLFKKYGDHYYMIGIPFRIATSVNGQIIPHLAYAISIGVAMDFIDQSVVTCSWSQ